MKVMQYDGNKLSHNKENLYFHQQIAKHKNTEVCYSPTYFRQVQNVLRKDKVLKVETTIVDNSHAANKIYSSRKFNLV
jgi:hypothetical protein